MLRPSFSFSAPVRASLALLTATLLTAGLAGCGSEVEDGQVLDKDAQAEADLAEWEAMTEAERRAADPTYGR